MVSRVSSSELLYHSRYFCSVFLWAISTRVPPFGRSRPSWHSCGCRLRYWFVLLQTYFHMMKETVKSFWGRSQRKFYRFDRVVRMCAQQAVSKLLLDCCFSLHFHSLRWFTVRCPSSATIFAFSKNLWRIHDLSKVSMSSPCCCFPDY